MINLHLLDQYRVQTAQALGWTGDGTCGAFEIPSDLSNQLLRCIAASGFSWDHVSVSLEHRIPLWIEMEQVKRLFFKPDECVMQLHPKLADYVDGTQPYSNPRVLHLWRPHELSIPVPPKWMVGGMTPEEADAALEADLKSGRVKET